MIPACPMAMTSPSSDCLQVQPLGIRTLALRKTPNSTSRRVARVLAQTFTGRVEADFEGNFSVAHNRNVSSLRSNALSLRLAYVRMDYAASENSDFYFEGGQDWTLFGSSALPNLLETTFFGAYYGNVYERSPQMMVGWVQKLGGSLKISPAFAIMMPSSAQVES